MNTEIKLKCYVISGKFSTGLQNSELYSLISDFFVSYWNMHFAKLGIKKEMHLSDFQAQEKIVTLFYDGKIVGMLTLNQRCLSYDFNTKIYLDQFSAQFINELISEGYRSVQSIQWLMISRRHFPQLITIPLAEIIVSLALRYQVHDGLGASLALARMDNPCASLGLDMGFYKFSEPIQLYGSPIAQLVCKTPQPNKNPDVLRLVDQLWNQRIESGFTINESKNAA